MDTRYTFWDNSTHYKNESVNFLGLMNSATKYHMLERLTLFLGLGYSAPKEGDAESLLTRS